MSPRQFLIKEVEVMCYHLIDANVIAMMASFPRIKDQVKYWDEEGVKSNYFINYFLKIEGKRCNSELLEKQTLTKVDTMGSFGHIGKNYKRRDLCIHDELKKQEGISEFEGTTRPWKLNTYGMARAPIRYLADACAK